MVGGFELHDSMVRELYKNPELIEEGLSPRYIEYSFSFDKKYVPMEFQNEFELPRLGGRIDVVCQDKRGNMVLIEVELRYLTGSHEIEKIRRRRLCLNLKPGDDGRIIYICEGIYENGNMHA